MFHERWASDSRPAAAYLMRFEEAINEEQQLHCAHERQMIVGVPLPGEAAAQLLHYFNRFGQLPSLLQLHRTLKQRICNVLIARMDHSNTVRFRFLATAFFAVYRGKRCGNHNSDEQQQQQPAARQAHGADDTINRNENSRGSTDRSAMSFKTQTVFWGF
jgi:hypothetical protein